MTSIDATQRIGRFDNASKSPGIKKINYKAEKGRQISNMFCRSAHERLAGFEMFCFRIGAVKFGPQLSGS